MRKILTFLTVTAVLALVASAGIAQNDQQQTSTTTDRPQDQSYATPRPNTGAGMTTQDQNTTGQQQAQTGQQQQMSVQSGEKQVQRLSQLRDLDVKNNQNEDLGKINDFVIDKRQGRIAYAVLSYGGMAGIGEKKFAIPLQSLNLTPDAKNFMMNVPKQRFEQAQGFKDQWPAQADFSIMSGQQSQSGQYGSKDIQSNQYQKDQYSGTQYQGQSSNQSSRTYGTDTNTTTGTSQSATDRGYYGTSESQPSDNPQHMRYSQEGASSQGKQGRSWGWGRDELSKQHPWLERASELIGQDVVNMQDEDLGEIDDLMVDMQQGKVLFAVLSHGGFMEMGQKLVAVPWNKLQIRGERNQLVLDMTRDQFKNAPSFEKSNWPDMSDKTWQQNAKDFFGQSSQSGSSGYYGQQQGAVQQQQTVEGTIKNISQYTPQRGMEAHYRAKIKTTDDKTMHVQLGPKSQLDQQGLQLKAGDRITVSGTMSRSWGREMLNANSMEVNGKKIQLSGQQQQRMQDQQR